MIQLLNSFALPNKQDFEFGASYGLITLQHFNNFDIRRLANGENVIHFTTEISVLSVLALQIRGLYTL